MKTTHKQFEIERHCSISLTDEDVKQHIKRSPKIDIAELLKQGYVEANKFHYDLEHGIIN